MTKLEHALFLASHGFHVFPVAPGQKVPLLKTDWRAIATRAVDQIREWWTQYPDANIGVAAAEYDGRALQILDVDNKGDKHGSSTLEDLEMLHADTDWRHTFMVGTPTGGLHFYYYGEGCGNSSGKLGPGLDVRSVGGYVLGPGSTIGGQDYVLLQDFDPIRVPPELDALMRAANDNPAAPRVTTPAVDELDDEGDINRALAYLEHEAPLAIEGAHGDQTTYVVAAKLRDFGISEGIAFEMMFNNWNHKCSPPWEYGDLERKVANAYRYARRAPGNASPRADFTPIPQENQDDDPFPIPGEEERSPIDPSWVAEGEDENIAPRDWIVKGFLVGGHVTLLAAAPGAGKTNLALSVALSAVTGRNEISGLEVVRQGKVMVWNNEDDRPELLRRLRALRNKWNVTHADIAGKLALHSGADRRLLIAKKLRDQVMTPVDVAPLIDTIRANGISVLIADPFLETHQGAENSNEEINQVAGFFRSIAHATGCSVLLVHHTKKAKSGDMTDARGAGSLTGVVRLQRHLYGMDAKEAAKYGIPADQVRKYVKLTDEKANLYLDLAGARWYEKEGVVIDNLDNVGVLVPVALQECEGSLMAAVLDDALAVLGEAAEMPLSQMVKEMTETLPLYLDHTRDAVRMRIVRAVGKGRVRSGRHWRIDRREGSASTARTVVVATPVSE